MEAPVEDTITLSWYALLGLANGVVLANDRTALEDQVQLVRLAVATIMELRTNPALAVSTLLPLRVVVTSAFPQLQVPAWSQRLGSEPALRLLVQHADQLQLRLRDRVTLPLPPCMSRRR